MADDKYYVYYFKNGTVIYERTCGTEKAAKDRCEELKKHYDDAKYFKNEIIRGAFY